MPTGLTQTTITVGKGQPSKSGPTIRASISRGRGSDSTEMSIGGPLPTSGSMTKTIYELAPGYTEADELCKGYHDKLLSLVMNVFQSLSKKEFTHLA